MQSEFSRNGFGTMSDVCRISTGSVAVALQCFAPPCSRNGFWIMSVGCRILTGNIASIFGNSRLFRRCVDGCSLSEGIALLNPVIESLRSPVLRTLCSLNVVGVSSRQCQMSAENIDSHPMQSEIYATQMYPMQLEIHPMSS